MRVDELSPVRRRIACRERLPSPLVDDVINDVHRLGSSLVRGLRALTGLGHPSGQRCSRRGHDQWPSPLPSFRRPSPHDRPPSHSSRFIVRGKRGANSRSATVGPGRRAVSQRRHSFKDGSEPPKVAGLPTADQRIGWAAAIGEPGRLTVSEALSEPPGQRPGRPSHVKVRYNCEAGQAGLFIA